MSKIILEKVVHLLDLKYKNLFEKQFELMDDASEAPDQEEYAKVIMQHQINDSNLKLVQEIKAFINREMKGCVVDEHHN